LASILAGHEFLEEPEWPGFKLAVKDLFGDDGEETIRL